MLKWTKRIVLGGLVLVGAAVILHKTGAASYLRSSKRMLTAVVKDSIPVEFEIQRARDLLEDLIPEMQANLRLVAAEEVDVAHLEKEIAQHRGATRHEAEKLQALRDGLKTQLAAYNFGGREYSRDEVIEELARRFEHLKTAEMLLKGKEDLLRNRRRSLDAAVAKLEKTRVARVELAARIEALEAQFRLVQAQSSGTTFRLDESKLARTQKVIDGLKRRLEVAQKELAWESRFIENIPVEPVNEGALVDRVDAYLSGKRGILGSSDPAPRDGSTPAGDSTPAGGSTALGGAAW